MATMEETELINKVGHWVLVQACKVAVAWPDHMRVAVNVSAVQLRSPGIMSSVVNALTVSTLPAKRLEIEITETALIDDSDQILSNLKALRELGVRVALDDFGTGYSSLTYLRKLSPDSIKIDGSFVRGLATDAECKSIVKSLISLSRDLSMRVVAEGIETSEQRDFLHSHKCGEGQGNYLCPPRSAHEIGTYLLGRNNAQSNAA